MNAARVYRFLSLTPLIITTLAGSIILSLLFFFSWQSLNRKVETILRDQFNQQQLMLARKIADNVEAYIDLLENALLGYTALYQYAAPDSPELESTLVERFQRHRLLGILEIRRYNDEGVLVQVNSSSSTLSLVGHLALPPTILNWVKDPAHRGRLFLSRTFTETAPPWQGRRVMRFLTPLYKGDLQPELFGALELLIDPFYICAKVTADVTSGRTGYAWIVDQREIILAHYEKEFVGQEAMPIRLARNPLIEFRGLREIHALLLAGKEGTGYYESGWHRQQKGLTPKLVAYTPVRFDKGVVRAITDVEDPGRNIWGVAVVAPLAEVSGHVAQVLHQELFLVGLFFVVVLLAAGGVIGLALAWNKSLALQVQEKTQELLASQERLMHSERFAAVGEAAAYVSHEIKNPLMVIGGLARQVERRLENDPSCREKLKIIQNEILRLENILGELRDFTRPTLPVKQKIDLNQVIGEVKALMIEAAREKGINLRENLNPVTVLVEADPNQIKQVLVNLIKNALEATEADDEILVSSGIKDEEAWLAVHDTGKGMPPEVMEKLFHPFFTTKDKGTGLGLAVIHKIITDHQGSIEVDSTPGLGSTFLIRLPRVD